MHIFDNAVLISVSSAVNNKLSLYVCQYSLQKIREPERSVGAYIRLGGGAAKGAGRLAQG